MKAFKAFVFFSFRQELGREGLRFLNAEYRNNSKNMLDLM